MIVFVVSGVRSAPAAPAPGPDQAKIDHAIDLGAKGLLKEISDPASSWSREPHQDNRELILLTLLHAGADTNHPSFQRILNQVLDRPLAKTYNVSLQAMVLEALDKEFYQPRLVQCAQFLVDNQCENGQWSYGEPIEVPKLTLSQPARPKVVGTGASAGAPKGGGTGAAPAPAAKGGTDALKRIPVARKRPGPPTGDNSNSQYAALGLRACASASVQAPDETLKKAEEWWAKCQNGDGGWDYRNEAGDDTGASYGSMTAGAVGGLAILDFLQKKDYKKDARVQKGLKWMADNFTVTTNPGKDKRHYYYLYALERAGVLCDAETIGSHAWYAEGAELLVKAQPADGLWHAGLHKTMDTCFAILFLKRATRRLVYTESK